MPQLPVDCLFAIVESLGKLVPKQLKVSSDVSARPRLTYIRSNQRRRGERYCSADFAHWRLEELGKEGDNMGGNFYDYYPDPRWISDEAEQEAQQHLLAELRVKKTRREAVASQQRERASVVRDGAKVPMGLTTSQRRLAQIARKDMTLAREIKAIRAYGAVHTYTKEDLKLWKANHPEFLLFHLGLNDDEILGQVKARKTTPVWAAAKILGPLENLSPDTVDDYSRRYRHLISRL